MSVSRLRSAAVLLAASVSLGGCATYGQMGGVGVSLGYGNPYASSRYGYSPYGSRYGYSPYGYSRYGSRYGYSPYGYSRYGYSPYGYSGYGYSPYWGWNDGFYYPGTGFYVYDRYRRAYRWNDRQRRYWTDRQRMVRSPDRKTTEPRQNWDDFNGDRATASRDAQVDRRDDRTAVRTNTTRQQTRVTRPEARQPTRVARPDPRQEVRQELRTRRSSEENRRDPRVRINDE